VIVVVLASGERKRFDSNEAYLEWHRAEAPAEFYDLSVIAPAAKLPAPLDEGDGPHDPSKDTWRPQLGAFVGPRCVPDPMPAPPVRLDPHHVAGAIADLVAEPIRNAVRRFLHRIPARNGVASERPPPG
jgi:hypothetical protein